MIAHYCPAELGDVILKVDEVFALLVRNDIVKVNILVTPFEVVDDTLVRKLLLDDEYILEEVYDALIDVEMVEFGDHCLLIFQVRLIVVNQGVALINDTADVIKSLGIGHTFEL